MMRFFFFNAILFFQGVVLAKSNLLLHLLCFSSALTIPSNMGSLDITLGSSDGNTKLCMHVSHIGLKQSKIGGEMVMKPLPRGILGPKPDQYVMRGFNCIGVTPFENGVNQFAGLCGPLHTFDFVQQSMEFTIQPKPSLVWLARTIHVFLITFSHVQLRRG